MKKRIVSLLMALVMALSLLPTGAFATDETYTNDLDTTVQTVEQETQNVPMLLAAANDAAQRSTTNTLSGSGTETDPYSLGDAAALTTLSNAVAAGDSFAGKYFKIIADITLPDSWTPIGSLKAGKTWSTTLTKSDYNEFSGFIDGSKGNGECYTITVPEGGKTMLGAVSGGKLSNLNIYGTKIDGYGVVEYYYVDKANSVKVEIDNVTLKTGTHTKYSGFIGGYASGADKVIIRNCTVESGVVIGDDGTYTDWKTELSGTFDYPWGPTGLQMNDMIGSFGGCFNGIIENCTSAAKVYGRNYVGGIVGFKGQSMGDYITRNCTFTGEVHASGKFAGGIVGGGYSASSAPNTPAAIVESCAFTGKVTGSTCVGGIFGGEEGLMQCWNNGIGLVRSNYSNGTITATDTNGIEGGIIGYMRSLNRYTVVSDNYYKKDTADEGIGQVTFVEDMNASGSPVGVGSNKTTFDGAHYGRSDDPTGTGAAKLTASFTEAELSKGTVTEKLNAALTGQGWIGDTPTRKTETHVVGMSSAELTQNPEIAIKKASDLDRTTPITVSYSDGTTETITLNDCTILGLNLTETGYQLCTAVYQGYGMVFGVNVKTSGIDTGTEITAYVTLSVAGELKLMQQTVTASDLNGDGKVDVDEVLYAAHKDYAPNKASDYGSAYDGRYGLGLTKLWGDTSGCFGYWLNNASCWNLNDTVEDGDYLSAFVYKDKTAWSDAYVKYQSPTAALSPGESTTLTLEKAGYDENWNTVWSKCEKAVFTVYTEDGEVTKDVTVTAAATAGSYTVSGTKSGTYYLVATAAGESEITVPAVCRLTVLAKGESRTTSSTDGTTTRAVVEEVNVPDTGKATVTITAKGSGTNGQTAMTTEVTIPTAVTTELKKAEAVKVETNVATLSIDKKALTDLTKASGDLVLTVKKADESTAGAKFELTAKVGNANVFTGSAGKITVTVPWATAPGFRQQLVCYCTDGGKNERMGGTFDGKSFSWDTNHFSTFEIKTETVASGREYIVIDSTAAAAAKTSGTSGTTGTSTTTTTAKSNSATTFDPGVGLYTVTAILSVTGMAWVGKKKH